MSLLRITDGVEVDPSEIASIQEEVVHKSSSPSGSSSYISFSGSVITIKNSGRKIYVRDFTPERIKSVIASHLAANPMPTHRVPSLDLFPHVGHNIAVRQDANLAALHCTTCNSVLIASLRQGVQA
jgi:hypothetical protein